MESNRSTHPSYSATSMDHTYIRAYRKTQLRSRTYYTHEHYGSQGFGTYSHGCGRTKTRSLRADKGAAAAPLLPADEDCRRRLAPSSDRRPRTDENGGLRPAVRVEGVYRGGFYAGGDANSPAEFSAAPRELPPSPIERRGCRRDGESAREEKREKRNGHGSLETADSAVPTGPGPRVL